MFGFSLTKLLFTIFAVMAVWHGFKLFARFQEERFENRNNKVRKRSRPAQSRAAPKSSPPPEEFESEDMVKCSVCETYVSANAAVSCGRTGCPYP